MSGPISTAVKTSQHVREEAETLGKSNVALTGWEAIENYMKRYDDGVVKDFTDDIDTMLVFAGLFSAVLTAFLAPTSQLLQPDKSQETVDLLTRISGQLVSFTLVPPFVNSTDVSFLPAPFQVAASAVTINALWFLSLTFSLAAALFGILVKQWLREYMKWDNVLAPSRENVLIRQVRLEAWEGWQVSVIITSIPALLEVAVVLFFIGMIVFLWTLERIVAILVTAAIGFFLALTVLFTLLPVLYRRCPYKTPSAWAFVYLSKVLQDFALKSPECRVGFALYGRLRRTCHRWSLSRIPTFLLGRCAIPGKLSQSWVLGRKLRYRWTQYLSRLETSLKSDQDSTAQQSPHSEDDFEPVLSSSVEAKNALGRLNQNWRDRDLHLILSNAASKPPITQTSTDDSTTKTTPKLPTNVDRHATNVYEYEFKELTKALSWVLSGSDSESLRRNVFKCLQRVRRPDGYGLPVARVRYFHVVTVLRSHPVWRILGQEAAFEAYYKMDCSGWMSGKMCSYVLHNIGFWHYLNYSQFALSRHEGENVQAELLLRFLLCELKYQYEVWELLLQEKRDLLKNLQETTERVVELTTVFVRVHAAFFYNRPLHTAILIEATNLLVYVYERTDSYDNAHRTGVMAMLLQVLCIWGDVTFDDDGLLRVRPVGLNQSYDTTDLLATLKRMEPVCEKFYNAQNQACRHTFILLTHFSFCVIDMFSRGYPDIRRITRRLLAWTQDVAGKSLVDKIENCGGWVPLPWVRVILDILEGETDASPKDKILTHEDDKEQLIQLLSTLERCFEAGLLSGATIRAELKSCFDLLDLLANQPGPLPQYQ